VGAVGDDEKAGLELGISKAAFYNWRRRYGLRQKPEFLKLEQLELNFPGMVVPSHTNSLYGKRTVAQKIFAKLAGLERVEIAQEVEIEPDLTVTTGGPRRPSANLSAPPSGLEPVADRPPPGTHTRRCQRIYGGGTCTGT